MNVSDLTKLLSLLEEKWNLYIQIDTEYKVWLLFCKQDMNMIWKFSESYTSFLKNLMKG